MKVDYIALSVPVFFILIGIELAYDFYKKLGYFRLNDSISNLSQGIGQQLVGIFMKTAIFFGYKYIFEHLRLFDLPNNIWVWTALFFAVDFFYYWFHRMSHQVNFLWAAHIVHHQSEEYNLTVALRQSWFQGWFSWIFYLPLAFLGFQPLMFLTLSAFNTLYQFWIHTRTIKSLGFLEYILNTPSHHRVHHGSNPKYIDRNHAGTLIIWDRLFGTFQKEEEAVYYGTTKPLSSWNPVYANVQYWDELIRTARKCIGIKDKIMVFLKPPGWFPAYLGGRQYAPEINIDGYTKFNPLYNSNITGYVLIQFITALGAGSAILFFYPKIPSLTLVVDCAFIMFTLLSCGALLEQKKWQVPFEYARLILAASLGFFQRIPIGYVGAFAVLQLISMIWFYRLQKIKNDDA
jgi:sterol desaturase/sphingolipid hydroxylase (fatty acid hydroxylase superfamily)